MRINLQCKNYLLIICTLFFVFNFTGPTLADKLSANRSWGDDFEHAGKDKLPEKWQRGGTKFGVPVTQCQMLTHSDGTTVLQLKCDKSTGGIIIPSDVDLNKTPIMHWRWRVLSYPNGADGRNPEKDDQPIGVYLGMEDGLFKKKSIAYRWEDLTPQGFHGKAVYAKILTVNYITMRNNKTPAGKWVIETRNVAEDFKRIYGRIPKKFAISVIGNSQYTQSNTVAEIDFIEFIPEK